MPLEVKGPGEVEEVVRRWLDANGLFVTESGISVVAHTFHELSESESGRCEVGVLLAARHVARCRSVALPRFDEQVAEVDEGSRVMATLGDCSPQQLCLPAVGALEQLQSLVDRWVHRRSVPI